MLNRCQHLGLGPLALSLLILLPSLGFATIKPADLYMVKPRTMENNLYFSGKITPLKNIPVISPTGGIVDKMSFSYGQLVSEGQMLLHIKSTKIISEYRDAKVAYLTAQDAYEKYKSWSGSSEVLQAEESADKSKRAESQAKQKYEQNKVLYHEYGIIPEVELNQSQDSFLDAQQAYKSALGNIKKVLAQGQGHNLLSKQLAYENANEKYVSLKKQLDTHNILAPADGIILKPSSGPSNTNSGNKSTFSGTLEVGSQVEFQNVLAVIGNLNGIMIKFTAPENNINQLKDGQVAKVTSVGFPGITLDGVVSEVGSQVDENSGDMPRFPVSVRVPKIPAKATKLIRSGMQAQVAITVDSTSNALSVPIESISRNKAGQPTVELYDPKTKTTKTQVITIGIRSTNNVQVDSGLKSGDQILKSTNIMADNS